MAVFLVNTCKFNSCGITFPTLTELIRHIEETHLDFDPRAIEEHESQQPSCLPISYILRVFADKSRKESINGSHSHSHSQSRKGIRSHSPALSLCSTPPTGSEMDDEDNHSLSGESSIDSWVNNNVDNDSANAILKIMSPQTSANKMDETDRPFVCTTGNCKKRYRNSNGLKYHIRKIHKTSQTIAQKKETTVSHIAPKEYKCSCGKVYKTSHGLKNHKNIHHNNNNSTTPQKQSQSQAQTQTSGSLPVSLPVATTQSSTPVQSQTTQTTSSSVQTTNTTIIGKTPIINGQTLSPATKESILATFVRCRPLQNLPTAATVNGVQTRIDGLPLMLTLQTDNENKSSESDSVTNDKKILINGNSVKKCPAIAAPTLQQHLLSPIVGKPTISVTKII